MEKPAEDRGSAGGLLNGVEIPTDLPLVPAKPLHIFGVGFEVEDHPGRVIEKGEVDDGFEEASDVILD